MNYLIVLLLSSNLSGIFAKSKSERLLLNDPSVLADRLGRVENSVTILKQTVTTQNAELQTQKTTIQALEQENTKLSIQNQQHTSDIQQLLNAVSTHVHGTTYVRWARTQCPNNNTELVYSGFAAGGLYSEDGASAEPVCLPPDPDFGKTSGPDNGRIYGAEFDNNFFAPDSNAEDVPCAVCRTIHASSVIMIPGKNKCYPGWQMEYYGYLASNYYAGKAAGTYECIDIQPEFLTGGKNNNDGKLFVGVLAKCGSLQCPPYKENYPLTCVMCPNLGLGLWYLTPLTTIFQLYCVGQFY